MIDLGALNIKVKVDNDEALNKLNETGTHTSSLGDKFKTIAQGAAIGFAALSTAVVATVGAVKGMVSDLEAYGSAVNDGSKKVGMSTDAYQEWSYVLGQCGGDIGSLEVGMKSLRTAMESGTGALAELGIATTNTDGSFRSTEDVFTETIAKLADVEDKTKQAQMATELFGKAGVGLLPALADGSASIDELKAKAHELGIVLNEETITAADNYGDAIGNLKSSFDGLKNNLVSSLLPALTQGANEFADFFGSISTQIAEADGDWNKIAEIGGNAITELVTKISEKLPDIVNFATTLVMTLIQGIVTNLPQILEAGIQCIVSLINGLAQALPQLIPAIVQAVFTMVTTLLDNIDLLIDSGIKLIMGLAEGLINAIPVLIDKAPEIIEKLITAILDNLPLIIEAGIELIIALAGGLIKAIPDLVSKIPEIVAAIVSALASGASKLTQVGKDLMNSLWNGLKEVWNSISSWFSGIWDTVSGWVSDVFSAKESANTVVNGKHRNGLNEVPYDGYIAELHKGEMVLTSAEADRFQNTNGALMTLVETLMNALPMTTGAQKNNISLTVTLDGKTLAQGLYNPLQDVYTQKGVA